MSSSNIDSSIEALVDRYRRAALERLEKSGKIQTRAGSLDIGDCSISFASDCGCETFNDDFVAIWKPARASEINWAAAIADGVTGSLLASEAAELACFFGLGAVAKANSDQSANARNPIAFVTRLFHQLGRLIQLQPEVFRPMNCPESIWRIAIREGKFLQTTLTLIWSTAEGLRVMAVGDGGLLYSHVDAPIQFTIHTFGTGKLQCIGPRSTPNHTEAYLLEDWSFVAGYTDGLAESVEHQAELPAMLCDRDVASVIGFLNDDCPELVNDNLSAFRAVKVRP